MAGITDGGGRRGVSWRIIGWGGAAALLLVPLIAMQFTNEVNWTGSDFVFAGVMLGALGLGIELAVRASRRAAYRLGALLALGASFMLVWINGAVGIIGSEGEGANLMFLGVIAVALVGSVIAGFRAGGMAWAMGAAAVAQLLVPVVAPSVFPPSDPAMVWAPEMIGSTGVFTAIWLLAAGLFRRAAQDETAAR